jgi:hypothetical protein
MRTLIAAAIAATTLLVGSAYAAQQLSRQDKQILDQLQPQTRQEVMSRMGPGQTVPEIVETLALNYLSAAYAEGRVQEIDIFTEQATVVYKDGSRKTVGFQLEEIVIQPQR